MTRYDVVIVGAGPVGLVAANLLGLYKIKTLLLEKEASPYTYPRAIGIDDEALRVLQTIEFSQEDFATFCKMSKAEYFSKSGYRYFEPDAEFKPFGYPIVSAFLQPKLELLLREKLKNYPSVTFMNSSELINYSDNSDFIHINALSHDEKIEVQGGYLLGCDGGKSIVRKSMGIELSGTSQKESWLVVDLVDSEVIRNNIECCKNILDFNRPVVTISLPEGLRRFEARLDHEEIGKGTLDDQRVEKILAIFLENTKPQIIRARVYDRYFYLSTAFNKGRTFLLGDAAHLVPPYGGQGMCTGIRDAANLCWKIAVSLTLKGSATILSTYEKERRYHLLKTIEFIKNLAYNVEDKTTEKQVNEHITTEQYRKLKPAPYYEDGFFIQSPYSGQLLLQPIVSTLKGKSALLDDFLGKRFAIIGINCHPQEELTSLSRSLWEKLGCRFINIYLNRSEDISHSNYNQEILIPEDRAGFDYSDDIDVLIVRPDRFILASCTINEVNFITEIIKEKLA